MQIGTPVLERNVVDNTTLIKENDLTIFPSEVYAISCAINPRDIFITAIRMQQDWYFDSRSISKIHLNRYANLIDFPIEPSWTKLIGQLKKFLAPLENE